LTAQQQGFILTRHWRDTPAGTEVVFWLATDDGPRQIRLRPQESVAFVPAAQRELIEASLRREPPSSPIELPPLELRDFHHRPVLGLYSRQYHQLTRVEKRLKQIGVDIYEADIFPPDRYMMERFIKQAKLHAEYRRIIEFGSRWNEVLRLIGVAAGEIPSESASGQPGSAAGGWGGGESEAH